MRHEQLLALIYDTTDDSKAWTALAEMLGEALGGSAVILSLPHPVADDSGTLIAPALGARFVEAYQRRYFDLDPYWHVLDRCEVGSIATGAAASLPVDFANTEFFKQWMEPQQLIPSRFLGGVLERDAEGGTAGISIFSRRGVRAPGSVGEQLVQRLMPHLCRAARFHFRSARLAAERSALSSAIDRLPLGVLLIDGGGRIRTTNEAADTLLRERDGISLGRDGLRVAQVEQAAALLGLIERAARSGREGAECMPAGLLLQRPSGRRPLEAVVAPVERSDAVPPGEPHLVAVFLSDPEKNVETPSDLLRSFYDLTPGEAALAQELASGHRLEEAAEHLQVTHGTARQRLSQVFAKTNTRRQASLVRLLLRGAGNLHWQDGSGRKPSETLEDQTLEEPMEDHPLKDHPLRDQTRSVIR